MSQSGPFVRRVHSLNFKTNSNIERKVLSYEQNENVNPDQDDMYDLGKDGLMWRNLRVKKVRLLGATDVTSQFDENGTAFIEGGLAVSQSLYATDIYADNLASVTNLSFQLPLQSTGGTSPILKLLYDGKTLQLNPSTHELRIPLDQTSLYYDITSSKVKVNIDNLTLTYNTGTFVLEANVENILEAITYLNPLYKPSTKTLGIRYDNNTIQLNGSNELEVPIDNSTIVMSAVGGLMQVNVPACLDTISYVAPLHHAPGTAFIDLLYDNSTVKVGSDSKLYIPIDGATLYIDTADNKLKAQLDGTTLKYDTTRKITLAGNQTQYHLPYYKTANNIDIDDNLQFITADSDATVIVPYYKTANIHLQGGASSDTHSTGAEIRNKSSYPMNIQCETQPFNIYANNQITLVANKTGLETPVEHNQINLQAGEITATTIAGVTTYSGLNSGEIHMTTAGDFTVQVLGLLDLTNVAGSTSMSTLVGDIDIDVAAGSMSITTGPKGPFESAWNDLRPGECINMRSADSICFYPSTYKLSTLTTTGLFYNEVDTKYYPTTSGIRIDSYCYVQKFQFGIPIPVPYKTDFTILANCVYFQDPDHGHIQVDPKFTYDYKKTDSDGNPAPTLTVDTLSVKNAGFQTILDKTEGDLYPVAKVSAADNTVQPDRTLTISPPTDTSTNDGQIVAQAPIYIQPPPAVDDPAIQPPKTVLDPPKNVRKTWTVKNLAGAVLTQMANGWTRDKWANKRNKSPTKVTFSNTLDQQTVDTSYTPGTSDVEQYSLEEIRQQSLAGYVWNVDILFNSNIFEVIDDPATTYQSLLSIKSIGTGFVAYYNDKTLTGDSSFTIAADTKTVTMTKLKVGQGITIDEVGLTVTAGGITVSAGGVQVTGDSKVTGAFQATGNTTIGGTLEATGNTTLGGTIEVTGLSSLNGGCNVEGALSATGLTTLQLGVSVTGVLDLNSHSGVYADVAATLSSLWATIGAEAIATGVSIVTNLLGTVITGATDLSIAGVLKDVCAFLQHYHMSYSTDGHAGTALGKMFLDGAPGSGTPSDSTMYVGSRYDTYPDENAPVTITYFDQPAIGVGTSNTMISATTVTIAGPPAPIDSNGTHDMTGTITQAIALYVADSGYWNDPSRQTGTITDSYAIYCDGRATFTSAVQCERSTMTTDKTFAPIYVGCSSPTLTIGSAGSLPAYYNVYLDQPKMVYDNSLVVASHVSQATTLYIKNAPALQKSVPALSDNGSSITASYALYIESGASYFGGDVTMGAGTFTTLNFQNTSTATLGSTTAMVVDTNGKVTINNNTSSTNYSTGALHVNGGISTNNNIYANGTVNGTAATFSGLLTGQSGLTVSSGSTSLLDVTTTTLSSTTGTFSGLITANAGLTVTSGQSANIGTSGTSSPITVWGLITGKNGLTISSGSTSLQGTTTTTLSSTTGTFSGLISGSSGLTVSSGSTSLQATTTTTLSSTTGTFSGLITGSAGLTISSGATSLQGTTTTTLSSTTGTFSGLISGSAGLTISSGSTSLQATTTTTLSATTGTFSGITQVTNTTAASSTTSAAFVVTGGAGVGGDLRVGGTIYGTVSGTITGGTLSSSSTAAFTGTGSTSVSSGTIYVNPASTTAGASPASYYWTYFEAPQLTKAVSYTATNAYNLYIAGAPSAGGSVTITNSYAVYVAAGNTTVQSFNATTGTFSGLLTGSNGLTISSGSTSLQGTTTTTLSSTTGTFSGLITGSNGLTISSGSTSLQGTTTTTLSATTGTFSGLITGSNGLTISSGSTSLQTTTLTTGTASTSFTVSATGSKTLMHGAVFGSSTGYNSLGNSQAMICGSYTYGIADHASQLVLLDNSSTSGNGGNCGAIAFAGPAHKFVTEQYMAAARIRAANGSGSFFGTLYLETLTSGGNLTTAVTVNNDQTTTFAAAITGTTSTFTTSSSSATVLQQLTNTGTGDCRLNLYCQNASPGSATISFRTGSTPTERFAIYTGTSGLSTGSFGLYNGGTNSTPFSMDYTSGKLYFGVTGNQVTIDTSGNISQSTTGTCMSAFNWLSYTSTVVSLSSDTNLSLTTGNVAPFCVITRSGITATRTDTLPTQSAIQTAYNTGGFQWLFVNNSSQSWNIAKNTGSALVVAGSSGLQTQVTVNANHMCIMWVSVAGTQIYAMVI